MSEEVNSYIQSVIFHSDSNKKWNAGSARKWLNKHNLTPIKRVDKKNIKGHLHLRYRINPPEVFKKFITKRTSKNISLVIGFLND